MEPGGFVYNLVLLVHLLTVVLGFGTAFVWPVLNARSKAAELGEATVLGRISAQGMRSMTMPMVWAAGVTGVLLVLLHELGDRGFYSFSDAWISIAFLLFFAVAAVGQFLLLPQQAKVQQTYDELSALPPGSPKPEQTLNRLAEDQRKAGMFTGIVHLLFILLMVDMVWKPFF